MKIFHQINPTYTQSDLDDLVRNIETSIDPNATKEPFFVWRLRVPIMLAFLVAFFNQLSGINAILYFAPRIFEWTGLAESSRFCNQSA